MYSIFFRMNVVEAVYNETSTNSTLNATKISPLLNSTELNDTIDILSTVAPTTDYTTDVTDTGNETSTLKPTVIRLVLDTALALQKAAADRIDHPFYIYIWTLGILGCIVLTTVR